MGYAIERDVEHAREARIRIPHVITGDYKSVRASVATFGVSWLNPPYEAASGDEKHASELPA